MSTGVAGKKRQLGVSAAAAGGGKKPRVAESPAQQQQQQQQQQGDRKPAAAAGKGGGGKQGAKSKVDPIVLEHKRIQWIGESSDLPVAMPRNAWLLGSAPPAAKKVAGRRYYAKVLLANGSEVRVGSSVLLQAPEGEEAFLAQVDQLWENEHDSFKMMKCRW